MKAGYLTVAPCLNCNKWTPAGVTSIGTACRVCEAVTYGAKAEVIPAGSRFDTRFPDVPNVDAFTQYGKRPIRGDLDLAGQRRYWEAGR